ncbi:MAG: ATPase [Clostridiales bacterium]|nr:ATPase [Clostridiales bacterium]
MSDYILNGSESLGIEFGSTRIKAVLVDKNFQTLASGSHTWENRLENGYWTYHMDDVWGGLRSAFSELNSNVIKKYGAAITDVSSICFSAMMHGYLPFDKNGRQLCQFRTWRNTTTQKAAAELTELFNFNIPQRWSIAHLYQAILDNEQHVSDIARITTLAGYVHYKLSGENVLGVGEASGMFPIDSETGHFDEAMLEKFAALPAVSRYDWNIKDILPRVLNAGEYAGRLSEEGALLIDPTGRLKAGALMAPPEGDAGTGMAATNSVREKTGNVSAGTSIFSMVVLEKQLSRVYSEIDMVTTPTGAPVAMVHCNNCCGEFDAWVKIFGEFALALSAEISKPELYDLLYGFAFKGAADCGGLVTFNYFSGEPVAGLQDGRPLFVRTQGAEFNLANFMRSQVYAAISALKLGMDILEKENVKIDSLTGHGGLFKTPVVGQQLLADSVNAPVTVCETAGEGGAWGAALLARYLVDKNAGETLGDFLENRVFSHCTATTLAPSAQGAQGFNEYIELYKKALNIEAAAADNI